jgi:hypothetical protein
MEKWICEACCDPSLPTVRPMLSTGQTGDSLCPYLLWQLCRTLLKYFFFATSVLFSSRRWKPWILARIELQRLVCHIFQNSIFATFSIIYMI